MKAEELIDFHLHTNYSDGYSTPLSVIKAAVTKKLKKICITDHYSHYKPALNSIDELNSYYQNLVGALKRIDNGTFGICKECAEVPRNLCPTCPLIPEERLMAVPIATMCVECKEKDKMGLL